MYKKNYYYLFFILWFFISLKVYCAELQLEESTSNIYTFKRVLNLGDIENLNHIKNDQGNFHLIHQNLARFAKHIHKNITSNINTETYNNAFETLYNTNKTNNLALGALTVIYEDKENKKHIFTFYLDTYNTNPLLHDTRKLFVFESSILRNNKNLIIELASPKLLKLSTNYNGIVLQNSTIKNINLQRLYDWIKIFKSLDCANIFQKEYMEQLTNKSGDVIKQIKDLKRSVENDFTRCIDDFYTLINNNLDKLDDNLIIAKDKAQKNISTGEVLKRIMNINNNNTIINFTNKLNEFNSKFAQYKENAEEISHLMSKLYADNLHSEQRIMMFLLYSLALMESSISELDSIYSEEKCSESSKSYTSPSDHDTSQYSDLSPNESHDQSEVSYKGVDSNTNTDEGFSDAENEEKHKQPSDNDANIIKKKFIYFNWDKIQIDSNNMLAQKGWKIKSIITSMHTYLSPCNNCSKEIKKYFSKAFNDFIINYIKYGSEEPPSTFTLISYTKPWKNKEGKYQNYGKEYPTIPTPDWNTIIENGNSDRAVYICKISDDQSSKEELDESQYDWV